MAAERSERNLRLDQITSNLPKEVTSLTSLKALIEEQVSNSTSQDQAPSGPTAVKFAALERQIEQSKAEMEKKFAALQSKNDQGQSVGELKQTQQECLARAERLQAGLQAMEKELRSMIEELARSKNVFV